MNKTIYFGKYCDILYAANVLIVEGGRVTKMEEREYERIASLYMNTIYRVALNASKNKTDAEDIVQITFLKLWKSKEIFNDDEHIRKWLIRVAINECNSLFRTTWKRKTVAIGGVKEFPVIFEESTELFTIINDLPVKDRKIIHLYYYEEYTVKEISEIMGISVTAVQTRLYRIRNRLREKLEKGGEYV